MTQFRASSPILAVFLILAPACGDSSSDDGGPGNLEPPAECAITAPPSDFVYPAGPYGANVDDTFENLAPLDDCDGNAVQFGDVLAQSKLTLLSIGAGWCQPCIDETETLDAEIFREYCDQGLRVVQVLFQDEEAQPATKLFCSTWRDEFSLSFPVLADPLFETGKYFTDADSQTPINFLVDSSGKIIFKSVGDTAPTLPQEIERGLAAAQ